MILTNKQAMILLSILEESVKMKVLGYFSISHTQRVALINEIHNQQSDEIIDLEDIKNKIGGKG